MTPEAWNDPEARTLALRRAAAARHGGVDVTLLLLNADSAGHAFALPKPMLDWRLVLDSGHPDAAERPVLDEAMPVAPHGAVLLAAAGCHDRLRAGDPLGRDAAGAVPMPRPFPDLGAGCATGDAGSGAACAAGDECAGGAGTRWWRRSAPARSTAFRVSPDLGGARPGLARCRPATCTTPPWWSIRAPIAGSNADWRGRPWHEAVLYELHAGAMGGFAGVQAALPRAAELGITAIELMPINDFPGARNWGYDGVLPYAPDTALGTPDELKSLVDAAHGLGLMVFLDVVYNHFGPDGAYLHAYAKPFFDEDIHTPWGAAIDFRQPPVRDFFEDNALFWLNEYRFDGLRFDAVHAIADADWLDVLAARIRRDDRAGPPRPPGAGERTQRRPPPAARRRLRRPMERRRPPHPAPAADRRARGLLRGLRRGRRREAGPRAWPRASCSRASSPAISARRAANPAPTCRRPPSSCSCRTTTRSATAPSANG